MPVYIYKPLPGTEPVPEVPFAEPPAPGGLNLLPPDPAQPAPVYELPSAAPLAAPAAGAAAGAEGGGALGFLAPVAEVVLPALALVLLDPSSTVEDELLMPHESPEPLQDPKYPFLGGQDPGRLYQVDFSYELESTTDTPINPSARYQIGGAILDGPVVEIHSARYMSEYGSATGIFITHGVPLRTDQYAGNITTSLNYVSPKITKITPRDGQPDTKNPPPITQAISSTGGQTLANPQHLDREVGDRSAPVPALNVAPETYAGPGYQKVLPVPAFNVPTPTYAGPQTQRIPTENKPAPTPEPALRPIPRLQLLPDPLPEFEPLPYAEPLPKIKLIPNLLPDDRVEDEPKTKTQPLTDLGTTTVTQPVLEPTNPTFEKPQPSITNPEVATSPSQIPQPTTLQPTTLQPTTLQPTTLQPTTLQPTTLQPTTLQPTTLQPTTLQPTQISTNFTPDPKTRAPIPTLVPTQTPTTEPAREPRTETEKTRQDLERIINTTGLGLTGLTAIKNQTTPEALKAAAKAGTCDAFAPNGCNADIRNNAKKAADKAGETNDSLERLRDLLNTTLNGFNATLIEKRQNTLTINSKLGEAVPGGISGLLGTVKNRVNAVGSFVEKTQIFTILIWWQTLHNAFMLSNDIATTLTTALSEALAALPGSSLLGIPTEQGDGQPLDLGSIIHSFYESAVKKAIGEKNYESITTNWAKANRIYQSASNLLSSVQSLTQGIQNVVETTGEYTGKIGNALKRFGVVGDKAYSWMSENMNVKTAWMHKLEDALQKGSDMASNLQNITSSILSTEQDIKSIKDSYDEFNKSIAEIKPKDAKDNKPVLDADSKSKSASASPAISDADQHKSNE